MTPPRRTAGSEPKTPAAPSLPDFEMVEVGTLHEHPDNARRGDVTFIAESIQETGWHGVVVADRATRRILVGNHRFLAARECGLTHVPVEWIDPDDDTAVRKMIADNRASDRSDWDADMLNEALELLAATPRKLAGTGFSSTEFAAFAAMQAADTPATDPEPGPGDATIAAGGDTTVDADAPDDDDEDLFPFGDRDPDDRRGTIAEGLAATLTDPPMVPPTRTVWRIGPHLVAVMHPCVDTDRWRPLLGPEPPDGRWVLAWAGPTMPFQQRLDHRALLIVQPDPYMAGWCIAALAVALDTTAEPHDPVTDPDPLTDTGAGDV